MNMQSLQKLLTMQKKNDTRRQILLISGIVLGAAALLTYPAILLYRRLQDKRNAMNEEDTENQTKSFAPNYRGNHKPHHRKAEANGNLHQAHA